MVWHSSQTNRGRSSPGGTCSKTLAPHREQKFKIVSFLKKEKLVYCINLPQYRCGASGAAGQQSHAHWMVPDSGKVPWSIVEVLPFFYHWNARPATIWNDEKFAGERLPLQRGREGVSV
jgi:hypothetical protein